MIVDSGLHPPVTWEIPERVAGLRKRIREYYFLEHGRRVELTEADVLKELDEAGADIGVLITQATGGIGFHVPNDKVMALAKKYPDRLVALASVDPTKGKESVDEFERAINDGFKGLILYPQYVHFYPNDEKFFPIYEKAIELDVPVIFIPYWSTPYSSIKYGHPSLLDDVAVQFRDLNIVIQGLGGGLFEETYVVACKNPNVYLTTSGCSFIYPGGLFERHMHTIINSWISLDRILFASEYPLASCAGQRKIIEGLGLSLGDKRKVLGENAARLLKL